MFPTVIYNILTRYIISILFLLYHIKYINKIYKKHKTIRSIFERLLKI